MTANTESVLTRLERWRCNGWILCSVALLSATTGYLVAARATRTTGANTNSSRLFELDIYHAVSGKVPALELRFRDAAKLQAKHGLNVIGYWVPYGDPAWDDTLIYLVAHSSADEADRNWSAFHADPEFEKYVKSEEAEPLIERVDTAYMRATGYSRMK